MALINWSSDLSVGVGEIDEQHKKLILIINTLNDAMRQGKGREVIGKIITGLVNYTQEHFSFEEKMLLRTNYPQIDIHKTEHAGFVNKIADYNGQFTAGSLSLSVEVMNFLGTWLKSHINGTDKKYTAHMNANGIN